jgi:hypothetical protein
VRAIAQDSYGPPDVRELREIDTPVAGDDEVLVRVHAAGLDQGVWAPMLSLLRHHRVRRAWLSASRALGQP